MLSTAQRAFCLAAVASFLAAGCAPKSTDTATPMASASAVQQSADAAIGISPGGVTTRIDEPAQSTEEQYAQACLAAKEWMDAKGGDPHTLVEPYLKEVQASALTGRAAFMKSWPELSGAQQAAVIIAVQAAADGGC